MRLLLTSIMLLLITAEAECQWQHIGPYSDLTPDNLFEAGRTDCIVAHPNFNNSTNKIMYAGSTRAGLWKTTDAGDNWVNINTDSPMKYSTIMAIGIESGTYGSLYVSDYPFSGVYRFSTSLSSWTPTGSFSPAVKEARHIKVHPSNNQYIYVCTNDGIYRSINGGTSWLLVKSGKYENIDFMPRAGGSGLYPYYLYAAGHNTFDVSSDDGLTFSPVSSVVSFFSTYTDVFPDLDYTIGENANEHYMYIYAAIKGSAINLDYPATQTSTTAYALYRLKYDALLGTETVTKLIIYRDITNSEDRLAITADKGIAYFGGECFGKYNSYTAGFYQLNNTGNDIFIGSSSTISNYWSFAHPDFHDATILPSYNLIFTSDDGGVHKNSYTTTASPGVYSNICNPKNNGLHISQVCGMSGTDDDPDLFMTGEQDTKVFKSHAGGITDFSHGTEPFTVMIDRSNADRYFYGTYQSFPLINVKELNGTTYTAHDINNVKMPDAADFCNYDDYNITSGGPFQVNTLYQHIQRPDLFYYGSDGGLGEYCPSVHKFIMKVRLGIVFSSSTLPGQQKKWCTGAAISFAMSETNQNKAYLTTSGHYFPAITPPSDFRAAQVIRFIGSNFQDSWVGHNEDLSNWQNITPDFQNGSVGPVMTDAEVYTVQFPGIAVSHWNENKAWAICRGMPSSYNTFKVMMYNNGIWSNYSTGIPSDEVMFSITAERGNNDMLYAGTDRGVYYRDATMSQWLLMGTNLPHNEIRQLQVNYGDNTLRAGTYGRGVWKSDLVCPQGLSIARSGQYVTTDDFVNAGDEIIASTVTIAAGYTKYRAVNRIELLPGFNVDAQTSARFYAFIHGCTNNGNSFRGNTGETVNEKTNLENGNINEDAEFNLYPNPTSNRITLQSNTEIAATINVFDLLGRPVIDETKFSGTQTEIDFSSYPPGIYLVRITTANKTQTIRLIKQ